MVAAQCLLVLLELEVRVTLECVEVSDDFVLASHLARLVDLHRLDASLGTAHALLVTLVQEVWQETPAWQREVSNVQYCMN